MAGRYDIVTGADPDLDALLAASGMDELDGLDAVSGDITAIMGAGEGMNMEAIKQRLIAQSSVLTQQQAPTKAREYPLGFESVGLVAAGATANIIAQPQVVFRGERLIVPSDIAGQFVITDLRVGKDSQFASAGNIPARTFDEQGVGVRLRLDTAQISQQIVLSVLNTGGAGAQFRATLIGTAVE